MRRRRRIRNVRRRAAQRDDQTGSATDPERHVRAQRGFELLHRLAHASGLPRSELAHAAVHGVVHEVGHRVQAVIRRGSRVALAGAHARIGAPQETDAGRRRPEHLLARAVVGARVRRRVEDGIARVGVPQVVTPPLERVVQPEVVAHLVYRGVPEVIRRRVASGQRRVQQKHAVLFVVFGELVGERVDPAERAVRGLAQVHVEVGGRVGSERFSDLALACRARRARLAEPGGIVVKSRRVKHKRRADVGGVGVGGALVSARVSPERSVQHVHLRVEA